MRSRRPIATILRINYQNIVMLPAFSELVTLPPGRSVRIEQVRQSASDPLPERFAHFHGPAELVFVNEGSGRFFSEAGEAAFAPGMVIFAPGMAIHDFAFDHGARKWTLVQFDSRAVDAGLAIPPRSACAARLDRHVAKRIAALLDWLHFCLEEQQAEAHVRLVLNALLLALRQVFDNPLAEDASQSLGLRQFRPLLQQWDRSPCAVLTLADAASLCALSPSYFSRLFKKTFGIGFIAYQTRFRVEQSARMLATSDAPVSQIAYLCGFHSHAYFTQRYKAAFGVPPSLHRARTLARKTLSSISPEQI